MSFAVGDSDSDDEFPPSTRTGNANRSSRNPFSTGRRGYTDRGDVVDEPVRQSHQYVDPFSDAGPPNTSRAATSSAATPAATSGSAARPRSVERDDEAYNEDLIFDDFTGGKAAYKQGTAGDVHDGSRGGSFNRYDMYDE